MIVRLVKSERNSLVVSSKFPYELGTILDIEPIVCAFILTQFR